MTASDARPSHSLDLNANALTVLERRYLVKDDQGKPVEKPEDLFLRVARTIAAPDGAYGASARAVGSLAETFFELMATRVWMPNSPTLMNAGRPLGQLSACFVLPVEDALSNGRSGIYDTLRAMALVHQSGGGTGFSFSRLRPKNDVVRSTMGVASGPVSFMKLYDASTDVVKQGGTRRGANMGILRVDHPDIMDFIHCKDDLTQVTNFNISVAVTDAFMLALEAGKSYDLIHPRTGKVLGQLDAREVFKQIVHGAWKTGEPGVFYIDRANHYNPVPQLGSYEATNPCGEQPLLPYDVCNLGSINVGLFVQDGQVDWDRLRTAVHLCTHFLDNVIDANKYPLEEIDDLAKRIRRVGLGIMGWADLLVRLGIPYNSDAGVALGRKLMQFIDEESKVASEKLAEQRGTFAEWERSIWGPDATCAKDARGERIRPMRKLRNCNLTTVAPTGTISIIAGCSSGIEPLFAVAFMRNQAGVLMPDVNEDFVAIAQREGWYSDDLMKQIAEAGHIHFDAVPEKWQKVFVTAHDVTPEWHIQMQAAFQAFTDSAISKTCNFGHDATEEYVERIYRYAYQLGCKGVTVYRDGARENQVLSTGATAKKVQDTTAEAGEGRARRGAQPYCGAGDRAGPHPRPAARRRGGESAAAREALAAGSPQGVDAPHRVAARHDVRDDHRGRQGPAVRGLHVTRQGGRGVDGGRRGDWPADFPRAPVRCAVAGDLPAAPRHLVRPRGGPRSEQSDVRARRYRHCDRKVDAGEAGRAAGPARDSQVRRPGDARGRSGAGRRRRLALDAGSGARFHRCMPRLWLAAGVHRGMCEMSRLRLLRMRMIQARPCSL